MKHSSVLLEGILVARRVKVDAKAGQMTLNGDVHSPVVKEKVEDKAKAVVGEDKVTSNISVTPS